MLSALKPLLLVSGLLLAGTRLLAGTPVQQPGGRGSFPHFRASEKRKLRRYKPKTWREKAPEPRLRPEEASRPTP